MTVRNLKPDDVQNASKIEKECLLTAWSEEQIAKLPESAVYLVAEDDGILCGIASMYCVLDDCEIMNVAVTSEHRKKGIASSLLQSLIDIALKKGGKSVTLEVAEDNFGAIALYEKFGFVAVGKRKNFYGDMTAIVMQKNLEK